MQVSIHPKWYPKAHVKCACGNEFTIGSTQPEIQVEVCSACHPFYTGQARYVDTRGRVDAFEEKRKQAQKKVVSKSEKRAAKRERRIKEELERPDTLEQLRQTLKKSKKAKKAKAAKN
jgi:large subunit ribosomal protein L31